MSMKHKSLHNKILESQLLNKIVLPLHWREDWSSAYVVSHTVVTDHTIWQPGFDLPHHTLSLMNRFCTAQGPRHANLHKWGLAQSPSCDCGQQQTDHEAHCRHVPINKIWKFESTPQSGWWRSHMAEIYSNCSTCDINSGRKNGTVTIWRTQASSP